MTFDELSLNEQILEAISYMGFKNPTPIQEKAIPIILDGKDLLACAQTGTGKTAAFILPILDRVAANPQHKIEALVIAPTRELALQIDQQIQGFAYFLGIESIAVYGGGDGDDWEQQKKALTQGADIVVATPGKLLSHINLGYVNFKFLKYLILDEADRMLDMGFHDDILKIIKALPEKRQSLMFSATMPPKIRKLAKEIMGQPEELSLELSKPAEGILQAAYIVYPQQRIPLVTSLIKDKPNYKSILIFSSTKKDVIEIVKALKTNGLDAVGISSDLDQKEREEALRNFKSKQTRIVVATDVLSRGIDIKDIDLVINYHVPSDAEDYVHRVGRTARAQSTGVALTLITPAELGKFSQIEKLIGSEVVKAPLPPELGKGPDPNAPRSEWGTRDGRDRGRGGHGGGRRSGGGNRGGRSGGGKSGGGRSGGNRSSDRRSTSHKKN